MFFFVDSNYQSVDSHDRRYGFDSGDNVSTYEEGGWHLIELHLGTLGHGLGILLVLAVAFALWQRCCRQRAERRAERRVRREAELTSLRRQVRFHRGEGGALVIEDASQAVLLPSKSPTPRSDISVSTTDERDKVTPKDFAIAVGERVFSGLV